MTETLFALGCGDSVAGITDYCIFPPDFDRPRVGGTKNPRASDIEALAPDLVHMNLEENLRRHALEIERFAPVFVTEPKSVSDVAEMLLILGDLHGCQTSAADRVEELHDTRASLPRRSFTFAVPIWKQPWMWCGGDTYVSRLVEAAGGTNVLADRERYPTLDAAEIDADVIFLPDEPYAFTAVDAEKLRVTAGARVGADAPEIIGPFPGHLFTWHGTRTIEGLRWLAQVL